ncbi:MAG: DUF1592 domain-containing protein [Gemmataceae bacterium]|nr:DUF1592 domain-containing protein [Gemmataceae bacterium]
MADTIKSFCVECHGPAKQSGSMSLHQHMTPDSVSKDRATWESVVERVRNREMPPKDKPQPTELQRKAMIEWIEGQLAKSDCGGTVKPGRVTIRRLNRVEYANSVRDLFGMTDLNAAEGFPNDDVGYGFDNIGDVLSLSPLQFEKYLNSAEAILDRVFAKLSRVRPTSRFYQARERDFTASGRNQILPEDQGRILFGGQIARVHRFEYSGEYQFKIRGYGTRVLDADPQVALRVGGKEVARFDIKAPRDGQGQPHRRARSFDFTAEVAAGDRRIEIEFLNPKTDDAAPADKPKDRAVVMLSIEVSGPTKVPPPEPTTGYSRVVISRPGGALTATDAARTILKTFLRRAYRRPPTPEEVEQLVGLVDKAVHRGETFDDAIRLVVKAVLVSPKFLFKVESDPKGAIAGQVIAISDFELATRLSYFLWSSLPDDELLSVAEAGNLRKPDVLRAQVVRMLRDGRSSALSDNFAGQWLQTRSLRSHPIDARRFPQFDEVLRRSMVEETTRFFDHVVRSDAPITDFLEGEYTFVNERLARHYGFAGVKGPEFRKVSTSGMHRFGILTHGSVLAVTSNPTRTSPVKRGKFVLENILGVTIPPPPPDVPELDERREARGTIRERLAQHRENPGCASCHDRMDPPGLAFENFDAIGRWRLKDEDRPVDAAGVMSDGTKFRDIDEFRGIIVQRKNAFRRTLVDRLMTYALGRGLEPADRCYIDQASKMTVDTGDKFSDLVQAIVAADPFQKRTATGTNR